MPYQDPYSNQALGGYAQYDEPVTDYSAPQYPGSATRVVVERMFYVPTGTYQQQYRRPWTAQVDNSNMNAVYDAVGHAYREFNQRKEAGHLPAAMQFGINPMDLVSVSSSVVMPAAWGESVAKINVNSLQQQNGRFWIEFAVYRDQAVEPNRYLAIGYTNYNGIVQKAMRAGLNNSDFTLDPNMELTINTIMEIRKTVNNYGNGYGAMTQMELVRAHQVLVDHGFSNVDQADVIRMRPYEVATSLARRHDPELTRSGVTKTDTRHIQNGTPEFSDSHNTNPNDYMAKILSGLTMGRDTTVQTNRSGLVEPYHQAARVMREVNARQDPFLKAIAGYRDGIATANFTFRDLCKVDPNAERDGVLFIQMRNYDQLKGNRFENMPVWDDSRMGEWHAQTWPAIWATQITNMLSSMMMDLAIRRVIIVASNIHREILCETAMPEPFIPDVNVAPQAIALKSMFYEQFCRPMSNDGRDFSYDLNIVADLYGDFNIEITLDGKRKEIFVMPAFAASAMAPVLTTNSDVLDTLAGKFHELQQNALPAIDPLITDMAYQRPPSGRQY